MRVGRKKLKIGQSGQALMEYIALLFIGTLMVLGLVYQFNDAFRQYLDAWFKSDDSGYLFCLIQNGFLPGESDVCTLPQFNLKNGKEKSSMGGTNGAGAGQNGGKGSGSGGKSGGFGSGLAGDTGGGRELIAAGSSFGGKGKSGAGGAKTKAESTGDSGVSSGGSGGTVNGANLAGRGTYRSGYIPIKDSDSLGGAVAQKPIPATERDLKPATRLLAADKARKKELEDEDFNKKFTFGKILKYVIIIFILFAIFFFIGSQLLAISQGGKKRR